MSQSPNPTSPSSDAPAPAAAPQAAPATPQERYQRAWAALGEQILRGRSFSGRERHHAFLGAGGGRFVEASAAVGFDFPEDGRALAVADLDDDGDLDLVVSHRSAPRLRLLRNDAPRGRVLGLRLRGAAGNADAIGAVVRVEATAADGTPRGPFVAAVTAGDGFLAQASPSLRIGLGDVSAITAVEVRWPGGRTSRHDGADFAIDASYDLAHDAARPTLRKRFDAPTPAALAAAAANAPTPATSDAHAAPTRRGPARVFFAASVPLPPLPYATVAGPSNLTPRPGRSLLAVLWAPWCTPCRAELAALQARAAELDRAGLDVVALSVDGLAEGKQPAAATVAAQARELGFVGATGVATPALLAAIEALHAYLTLSHQPLPLPTSFLIDRQGDLAAVTKGALDIDRTLADAAVGRRADERAAAEAISVDGRGLAQGRWLDSGRTLDWGGLAHALASGRLANLAVAVLDARMQRTPDDPAAHNDLGVLLARLGDLPRARERFARAVALAPDNRAYRANLDRANLDRADLDRANAAGPGATPP